MEVFCEDIPFFTPNVIITLQIHREIDHTHLGESKKAKVQFHIIQISVDINSLIFMQLVKPQL